MREPVTTLNQSIAELLNSHKDHHAGIIQLNDEAHTIEDKNTAKARLQELKRFILSRANGFREAKGLFAGSIISDELGHWAREIEKAVNEE